MIVGSVPLLLAFIASLGGREKQGANWSLLFPWFLFFTFVIQWTGFFLWPLFQIENQFLFNIYMLTDNIFYLYVFYSVLKKPLFKKIVLVIGTGFLFCYLFDVIFVNRLFTYGSYAANAGNMAKVGCGLLFFTEILMSDEYIDIFRLPMFWIATGIIISAVGVLFYLCFFNYITNDVDKNGRIWGILATILSVIEYGFFTVGFILKKKWAIGK
jgi:hypothetical protein